MRFILSAVLALAFLSAPALAWDIDKMNEQIEKTNVIVGGVCSGTIIDKAERLVLTAHHCITQQVREKVVEEVDEKTGEIKRKTVQERLPLSITVRKVVDFEVIGVSEHMVKIVGMDAANDIAVLQVVDVDFVPAMAARLAGDGFKYRRGVRIFAVGNPGVEFDNSITEGIISAPQRKVDFGGGKFFKLFQFSAGVIGGNSGGSILNDDGELIGTVTGGIRGSAVSFGIPISATKELLKKSGFGKTLETK